MKSFLTNIKLMTKQPWLSLWIYLMLALIYASWFYSERENIKGLETFFDSIYFSFVTITTLGYGDILPDSKLTKFYVILESISGVILLGFFLIAVSSEVSNKKERKRIETQKLSFKEQYKIWRENTINVLMHLTTDQLNSEEIEELYDNEKLINYLKKNNSEYWYEICNNFSENKFYSKEILHEIEFLQRNIEIFIMQVPIENSDSLNILNRYINGLYKLRKYDLSENDEYRSFMRQLWGLITSYDSIIGEYNKNYLTDTIESI